MKSKKPSSTWKLLEAQHEFFLDRNQGHKIMPAILRQAGIRVTCHADVFADEEMPDPDWIQECSRKDWIVITGDKAIETDPTNRQAVIDHRAKVFLLDENESRAVEWASAILVSRRQIVALVQNNDGPFFASIRQHTKSLVSKIRKP